MSKRIVPRIISTDHLKTSVKPMRAVDLIAESRECTGKKDTYTSCDVGVFLRDMNKNLYGVNGFLKEFKENLGSK